MKRTRRNAAQLARPQDRVYVKLREKGWAAKRAQAAIRLAIRRVGSQDYQGLLNEATSSSTPT
jgi:hypothetical protein